MYIYLWASTSVQELFISRKNVFGPDFQIFKKSEKLKAKDQMSTALIFRETHVI